MRQHAGGTRASIALPSRRSGAGPPERGELLDLLCRLDPAAEPIAVIASDRYCEFIHERRWHPGWWLAAAGALAAAAAGLSRAPRARTLLRRWVTIGGLGGRTSARAAAHSVRRVAAPSARREELDAAFQLRSAEDVAATLGNMKGAFMKVGQLLSFVDDGLPENIRTALAQLQDSAPPMSAALAASGIEAELGGQPQDVFAEWEPEPFAAASIGARSFTGTGTLAPTD